MPKGRSKRTRGAGDRYTVYRFKSSGHETKIVFAGGIWSAVGIFLQWREANGIGQVSFEVEPDWGTTLSRAGRQHIDEARMRCRKPSFGTSYRADVGWTLTGVVDTCDP